MSDQFLPEMWRDELYAKPHVTQFTTCNRWLSTTSGNNNAYTGSKSNQQRMCNGCGIWVCPVRLPQKGTK